MDQLQVITSVFGADGGVALSTTWTVTLVPAIEGGLAAAAKFTVKVGSEASTIPVAGVRATVSPGGRGGTVGLTTLTLYGGVPPLMENGPKDLFTGAPAGRHTAVKVAGVTVSAVGVGGVTRGAAAIKRGGRKIVG